MSDENEPRARFGRAERLIANSRHLPIGVQEGALVMDRTSKTRAPQFPGERIHAAGEMKRWSARESADGKGVKLDRHRISEKKKAPARALAEGFVAILADDYRRRMQ
ncbi:MAG: hypothetical protein K8H87_05700 [Pseudorhodoplanes sp.]|nr:hypothetical protein [Pseudorhodoplanes sp.]